VGYGDGVTCLAPLMGKPQRRQVTPKVVLAARSAHWPRADALARQGIGDLLGLGGQVGRRGVLPAAVAIAVNEQGPTRAADASAVATLPSRSARSGRGRCG
jgi:hypothetical protein